MSTDQTYSLVVTNPGCNRDQVRAFIERLLRTSTKEAESTMAQGRYVSRGGLAEMRLIEDELKKLGAETMIIEKA